MINRRQLLTGASMLAAERALAQPTGNAGWRDLPWGPSQSANTGGNIGGPSFDQNFLTGSLNPASGAVFSRASTGTYYDSAGVLRTSPVNLVRNSMMVGGVAPTTAPNFWNVPQLLPGGSASSTFAYGTANGVPYIDLIISVTTPMGSTTPVGLVVETILTGGVAILTTAAITYQLVAGSIPAGSSFNSVIWPQSTTGFISNIFTPTATPQRIVTTGSSVASDTQIVLFISINCPAALTYSYTLRISQPQLETGSVASPFIPTTTAASGAPRFDYDPQTLALKGLLLEDASTNVLLQSAAMDNAAWFVFGGSGGVTPVVTANQAVAPDGTTTADKIVYAATSAAGAFVMLAQQTTVAAQPYAFSVWLRGNAGGEQLYLTVSSGTGFFYSSPRLSLTTAWQRFSVVSPTLTAAGWYFQIGTDLRDTAQASTPAATIFAWGGQAEPNYTSSYIPTTTAAVTRAVDNLRYPIASVIGFDATKGSLAHEYYMEGTGGSYASVAQFVGANTNTDFITVAQMQPPPGPQPTMAGGSIAAGGSSLTYYNLPFAPVVPGVVHRSASAWLLGSPITGAHDGVGSTVGSGVASSLPVITNLTIAGLYNFQFPISQWARRTRYWPRQMPQPELIIQTVVP